MKPFFAIFAGLVFAAPLAQGQVIINPAALDQLAGVPPVVTPAPPEIRAPAHRVIYRPGVHRYWVAPHMAGVVPKPTVVAPKVLAPRVQPVVAKPVIAPPPPPPAAAIVFAAGAADLPADVAARLKPFCKVPGQITIDAYGAADASDPSAAPRLSMARAFALRDALLACGVPSASIIPRADGVGNNPDVAQIAVAP